MGFWQKITGAKKDPPAPPQTARETPPQPEVKINSTPTTTNFEENAAMQDDLITTENLSPEFVKSVFDAAFMESTMDKDGEIIVQDAVKVRVLVNKERKDRIRLLSVFGFKSSASELARLQCVNKINSEYIVLCASAEGNLLFFRYDLLVAGGLTKKGLVMAIKRFATIPHDAVADHGRDIVE